MPSPILPRCKNLTALTGLILDYNPATNAAVVAGLTNLTFLAVVGNSLSNLSFVSGLTQMQHLEINGNPQVYDLSPWPA